MSCWPAAEVRTEVPSRDSTWLKDRSGATATAEAGHQLPVALVRFQVGSKFKAANGLDRNFKPAKIGKRRKPPKENIQRHTFTETPALTKRNMPGASVT